MPYEKAIARYKEEIKFKRICAERNRNNALLYEYYESLINVLYDVISALEKLKRSDEK